MKESKSQFMNKSKNTINRRNFISKMGMGSAAALLPTTMLSFSPSDTFNGNSKDLKFGIVADVHKDLIPDADSRLQKFINEAQKRNVDFIIQLGDFCMANPKNKGFLNIWESFKGPKYHVLGNHDMDRNTKEEMLDFWGMPKTYYSYDFEGFHFVVLDANFLYKDGKYIDYKNANFYVDDSTKTFINDEQIAWFQSDLEKTKLPTIVFSHQSLWHYQWGVKNRLSIQKIMESHKDKIICCMNGHNHIDYHHNINGIDYVEINSMSYQWNEKYPSTERFEQKYYKDYPNLPNIASYVDPLYAFATINPKGKMQIEGVKSNWSKPSPYDLGMQKAIEGSIASAQISDYKLRFNN